MTTSVPRIKTLRMRTALKGRRASALGFSEARSSALNRRLDRRYSPPPPPPPLFTSRNLDFQCAAGILGTGQKFMRDHRKAPKLMQKPNNRVNKISSILATSNKVRRDARTIETAEGVV